MVKQKKIPDGYKMSEVGVIPCEWEVKKLGDLTNKIGSGITPRGGVRVYKTKGRPFVRSQNVKSGYLDLRDIVFIDQETHNTFSGTELRNNDVLLNITGASIGRSAVVNEKIIGGNVNQHVCILRPNKENLDSIYLCEYLISVQGQKFIDSFQSGGNREGLNFKQIASISIPIPKIKEQKSIATALSDMDDLILSMKKLIDKKKLIKQGTMQELFSEKKISDEKWNYKSLENVANITMGQSPDSVYYNNDNNGLPLIQGNADIENRKTIIRSYTSQITKRSKCGDIIMTVRAPVGKVAKAQFDCCIGRGVCAISYNNDFLYHYLIYLEDSWGKLSKGSTFDSINSDEVKSLIVPIPSEEEQKAIAKILSDMDQEIEKLEIKLDKYKQIKKGMMEELLTGKRRLI
jgi:type I restriction enzyme, S subunit